MASVDDRAAGRPASSVAGVVLAAGSSRRLGQPKQLLAYRGSTLLEVTLARVRSFGLAQTIVTLGGAAPEVRSSVDLAGVDVVDSVHHTEGCSSSIVAALSTVAPAVDGFLLFLGDQPHVSVEAVSALLAVDEATEIAVVRYRNDDIGHPFWFARSMFAPLAELHGDKAVWKLLESGRFTTAEVELDEPLPLDVDTWDDYERLLAADTEPA
ncbi:MAG: nucleotidyltransferase family protein [Actinomycetota bacterium]